MYIKPNEILRDVIGRCLRSENTVKTSQLCLASLIPRAGSQWQNMTGAPASERSGEGKARSLAVRPPPGKAMSRTHTWTLPCRRLSSSAQLKHEIFGPRRRANKNIISWLSGLANERAAYRCIRCRSDVVKTSNLTTPRWLKRLSHTANEIDVRKGWSSGQLSLEQTWVFNAKHTLSSLRATWTSVVSTQFPSFFFWTQNNQWDAAAAEGRGHVWIGRKPRAAHNGNLTELQQSGPEESRQEIKQ